MRFQRIELFIPLGNKRFVFTVVRIGFYQDPGQKTGFQKWTLVAIKAFQGEGLNGTQIYSLQQPDKRAVLTNFPSSYFTQTASFSSKLYEEIFSTYTNRAIN